MASFVYDQAKGGGVDNDGDLAWLTSGGLFVTLLSGGYVGTASPGDIYASAFSGSEVATSDFSAGFDGSIRLSIVSTTITVTAGQAEYDGADVNWDNINSAVASALVVLRQSGSDALSELLVFSDQGFPITFNGASFAISWANSGIFKLASA